MPAKKNFVDFIVEAQSDPEMVREFIGLTDASSMRAFFDSKGITEISDNDIKKLVKVKANFETQLMDDFVGKYKSY